MNGPCGCLRLALAGIVLAFVISPRQVSAQLPVAWRLVAVAHQASPGTTQFEVQQLDERGGRVRIVRAVGDASCPGGAVYLLSWRIDGDVYRLSKGQSLLVSFEGHQTGGERCPNGEPRARAGTGEGAVVLGWPAGSYRYLEGPGYKEFYLHPAEHADRHLGQWPVMVPENVSWQPHLYLGVQIDTSGNSGGQWLSAGLLYDAEQAGSPPAGGVTGVVGSGGGAPGGGAGGGGDFALEHGTNRYGGDYTSFAVPSGDPTDCAAACSADARCRAFSFVLAGQQEAHAMCWLKDTVPPPTPNACCISGVMR